MYMDNQQVVKPKKYSVGEIKQGLATYCAGYFKTSVTKIVMLSDCQPSIRHSCFHSGITSLNIMQFTVQHPDYVLQVPFYFCNLCGTLFICGEYLSNNY